MEIQIGKKGTNIFVRMVGLSSVYISSFSTNYHSTFDGKQILYMQKLHDKIDEK